MSKNENDKERCGICKIPKFERNNFFYSKLMTVRDFNAEQCYFNEKRWLINKATIGWGVVCGLKVVEINDDTSKVKVLQGMAIDCCGREILVCEDQVVDLVPETDECEKGEAAQETTDVKYLICIEYRECKTEPLPLPPISCDQKERCEFNRIRDSFRIRVIPYHDPCKLDPYCPQKEEKDLHKYLCKKLLENCPECPDFPDCPESHCVILAVVTVTNGSSSTVVQNQVEQQEPPSIEIDNCIRRKFVYSNSILYDLIHCYHGDLPHIEMISFKKYHNRKIGWRHFKKKLEKGILVKFDKKMQNSTINVHTFLLEVITVESGTGYRIVKYIPLVKEETNSDYVTEVLFNVEESWKDDELKRTYSEISSGAVFQIILRGDHILDERGKALDGNFIGKKLPSGNGTQGGDFVLWFYVEAKGKEGKKQNQEKIDEQKEE